MNLSKALSRITALALSVMLLLTQTGITAYAEEGAEPPEQTETVSDNAEGGGPSDDADSGLVNGPASAPPALGYSAIVAFAPLDEEVAEQDAVAGTAQEDLALPDILAATVENEGGEQAQADIPVEGWSAEPEYDPLVPGTYLFTPELPEGYALDDGVEPPQVTVQVFMGIRAAALGDYNAGDVAVINAIIRNNNLTGYNVDDPDYWTFVSWDDTAPGKRVRVLYLSNRGLTGTLDVSGLANLVELYCNGNDLSALDVSGLDKLKVLYCYYNANMQTLDVDGCSGLVDLRCSGNDLAALDVAGLDKLEYLYCHSNANMRTLDVDGCSGLVELRCYYNDLAALDVSGLDKLERLDCSGNANMQTLDVDGCSGLETLYCYNNDLAALDVSGLDKLEVLYCYNNANMQTLDVDGCTGLVDLRCYYNDLAALDVSGLSELQSLGCNNNSLTGLDLSGCDQLSGLDIAGNSLQSLKLTDGDSLSVQAVPAESGTVIISDYTLGTRTARVTATSAQPGYSLQWTGVTNYSGAGRVITFAVSGNMTVTANYVQMSYHPGDVAAINAIIDDNGLTGYAKDAPENWDFVTWSDGITDKRVEQLRLQLENLSGVLDVTGLTQLKQLTCNSNSLTGLKVFGLEALESLNCISNSLTELDTSGCTSLTSLACQYNPINSLKLPGGESLRVLIAPAGHGRVNLNAFSLADNTVTLAAGSAAGYGFSEWTGGHTGTSTQATFSIVGDMTVTANFVPLTYHAGDVAVINAIIDNNGLSGYSKDDPASWDFVVWTTGLTDKQVSALNLQNRGLTGTLDVSGLSGVISALYCYNNNLTGLNTSGKIISALAIYNNPFQSLFIRFDSLLIDTIPADGGTVMVTAYTHGYGDSRNVTLTATERYGYSFAGWTGAHTDSSNTISFKIDADMAVTANFTADLNPAYHPGDVAAVNAIMAANGVEGHDAMDPGSWIFATWSVASDNRRVETLDLQNTGLTELDVSGLDALQDLSCHGNPLQSLKLPGGDSLRVNISPAEGGTVQMSAYNHLTKTVTLDAVAEAGYSFTEWTGTPIDPDSSSTVSFKLSGSRTVTAFFSKDKTDVSGNITFANGSATYTGSPLAYAQAAISGITAAGNPSWDYTYATAGPGANLSGGKPLTAGDYTVTATYEDDENQGSATATFTVMPITLTVTAGSYTVSKPYDGSTNAGTGSGGLMVNGLLAADSGVTVTAAPRPYTTPDAGSYTVTVDLALVGTGNYRLAQTTLQVPARIEPVSLTGATVNIDPGPHIYTGSAITPPFTVTLGSPPLTQGTDFTPTLQNNVNAGTATLIITGIGNYSGTVNKSFTIDKATVLTITPVGSASMTAYDAYVTHGATDAQGVVDAAGLPASVAVNTDGGGASLPITWSTADAYNAKGAYYTVIGTLTGNNNILDGGVKANTQINVTPVTAVNPTFTAAYANVGGNTAAAASDLDAAILPTSGSITVEGVDIGYTIDWNGGETIDLTTAGNSQTFTGVISYTSPPAWLTLPAALTVSRYVEATNKSLVTISAGITDKPYSGGVYQYGAAAVSGGSVNPSTLSWLWESTDGGSYSSATTPPTDAGGYKVTISVPVSNLTHYGSVEYLFRITRAPLEITAGSAAIRVGESLPPVTIQYSGFVGGEDETTIFSTMPAAAHTAPDSNVKGDFPIVFAAQAVQHTENYSVTYTPGNLRIDPRFYTITVSANLPSGGTVSGGGNVEADSVHTVTATPYSGWVFENWTEEGREVSSNAAYAFNVSSDRSLVANFYPDEAEDDDNNGGNGGNSGNGGGSTGGSGSRGGSGGSSTSDSSRAKTQLPASAFSWDGGRTLTINHDNVTPLGLQGVRWNGETLVQGTDYTVYSGSVILRFSEAFIAGQRNGNHTVRVEFMNHTGEYTLSLGGAAAGFTGGTGQTGSGGDTHNPQTGDFDASPWWWMMALLPAAALTFATAAMIWRRLRQAKEA